MQGRLLLVQHRTCPKNVTTHLENNASSSQSALFECLLPPRSASANDPRPATQRVWAPGPQVPYRSGRLSKHSGASSCQLKFGPILCVSWRQNKRLHAWACSRLPSNLSVSDCGPYRLTRIRQWTAGPEGKRPCLLTLFFFFFPHPAHIETSICQRLFAAPILQASICAANKKSPRGPVQCSR